MRQDVWRHREVFVSGSKVSRGTLPENLEVDVTENAILRHQNEGVDYGIGQNIRVCLHVVPDVLYKFAVGHVITVTVPIDPTPTIT